MALSAEANGIPVQKYANLARSFHTVRFLPEVDGLTENGRSIKFSWTVHVDPGPT